MHLKKIIATFTFISIGLLLCDLFCSRKLLSVSQYKYKTDKMAGPLRVVQLSDLHNYQYGRMNKSFIRKIQKLQPDVIFMTGDMLNDEEMRTDIVENLIAELKNTAPVYYSLGNHEVAYTKNQVRGNELTNRMKAAGAVVLEQKYVDTEIAGQPVRIGGVYGYILGSDSGNSDGSEQRFMEKFQKTERLKILLSHIPEGLLLWKSMEKWDVDLIFSGHVHGGQMRLPLIGGLYDPEEGWFPTYTKGMFECGNSTMILSSGLGSSRGIPRIHNLPEIVVCDINPQ